MHDDTLEYLILIYTTKKRLMLKGNGSKYYKLPSSQIPIMKEVTKLIIENEADVTDFLQFAVQYYSKIPLFPSPSHLLNEKLWSSYKRYQRLKRRYTTDIYRIDGDEVTLIPTYEVIPYKEFISPVDKDTRYKYTLFILKSGITSDLKRIDIRAIVYTYAKLKYLRKPIPIELSKLWEIIWK